MIGYEIARHWAGRLLGGCGMVGLAILAATATGSCTESPASDPVPLTHLHTDRTYLRDELGRYVFFHGVNTSGSSKVPFEDGKTFTYIGRPFPIERARYELGRLRDMGFNSMRLLLLWEAVEPDSPGKYDENYLSYIRQVVQLAGEYGMYVLMDVHQDMFSRHLMVRYNESPDPQYGAAGTIQNTLLSLVPPYSDVVRGDGAPRWVIEACMPEKNLSSEHWGIPRIASGLNDPKARADLIELYLKLSGSSTGAGGQIPDWINYLLDNLPPEFPPNESTDMLPFTNWGISAALSMDVERAYACLFAGDTVFPGLQKDGKDIKEYLQTAYGNMWTEVARHVSDLPNVMGYDIINEPEGNFLVLGAEAAVLAAKAPDGAKDFLIQQLGTDTGTALYNTILALRLLPPDMNPDTLKLWGLDKLDAMAVLGLNFGFDKNYLTPFYDRIGKSILAADPKAIVFIEPSSSASNLLSSAGLASGMMWDVSMTRPPSLPQVVYSPHNYADIYPFIGFNQPPRNFTPEEVRYRDYTPAIQSSMNLASHSLGNIPTVFGEFGTYFNFNGIQQSIADNYVVSTQLLDNYYEAFDNLFQSNILWCYSPDNDYKYGDSWNHEDFSIIDPKGQPRSQASWARPFVRALAGKPISIHFYSDMHYFDPDKGTPNPLHEFEVKYASRETDAPTEITVPELQYPDGFYVWVSDGSCFYDSNKHILYHYPDRDEPDAQHWVRMLPPLPNNENTGWKYFFKGDQILSH